MPAHHVTYGYARVSKTDDDSRDLGFTSVASGRSINRPGRQDLMARLQPGDTIAVVAIQEQLYTRDVNGGEKALCRRRLQSAGRPFTPIITVPCVGLLLGVKPAPWSASRFIPGSPL